MTQGRNNKGQFKKGATPWNAGLKNVNNVRPNKTSFQEGKNHPRYKPIGSERIDKDGNVVVKITDKKWLPKHKHIWEQSNGPVPKGHIVIFANGNKRDFSIDNLLCVSRSQAMILNKNNLITNDTELTKTGVIVADLLLEIGKNRSEVDG